MTAACLVNCSQFAKLVAVYQLTWDTHKLWREATAPPCHLEHTYIYLFNAFIIIPLFWKSLSELTYFTSQSHRVISGWTSSLHPYFSWHRRILMRLSRCFQVSHLTTSSCVVVWPQASPSQINQCQRNRRSGRWLAARCVPITEP